WRNDHQHLCIFSTQCSHISPTTRLDEHALPCNDCASLLKLEEFKKVLRVAMPSNENYKFVSFQFRNEVLGKHFVKVKEFKELFDISLQGNCENSIFVHFAKGAIQGKYKENDVFLGLVKAMTQKIDCDERGVGMQNSHYAPAWDEFVQIVCIYSPRAHDFLCKHFSAHTARN
ncbi:hypothetical protein EV359DRAFT_2763, partial [Lentinula novae-zelandiae]